MKSHLVCASAILSLATAALADNSMGDMKNMPPSITTGKAQKPISIVTDKSQNPKAFTYTVFPTQKSASILRSVVVGLDIDNVQATAMGGIKLKLSLVNQGKSTVMLSNPLDTLNIFVWDKIRQHEVRLPFMWRRTDIDDFHPSHHKLLLPYKLSTVRINNSILSQQQVDAESIGLSSGDRFEAEVELDKVEDPTVPQVEPIRPGAFVDPSTQKLVTPPPGQYQVSVGLAIINYRKPVEQIQARTTLIDVILTP